MSYRTITLNYFLDRLKIEEDPDHPMRFTWLIGAGFSVSAGLPLASEVSKLIMLFEYFACKPESIPWENSQRQLSYNTNDLTDFFGWYMEQKESNSGELKGYLEKAESWLKAKDEFKELEKRSINDPEWYQRLFSDLLMNQGIHRRFLTTLISTMGGVNLAHLGLAGILKDYPEWGHTVFTTNFDDLLLKALLSINYTARIFGELKSKDIPNRKPDYPQIVHLHGRHTGYKLKNTRDDMRNTDEGMQSGLKDQLVDSHLLVVGYGGWDDVVMKTLEEWDKDHDQLIGGNLYWVAYDGAEKLPVKVKELLKNMPSGRVFVIEHKGSDNKKLLSADNFILELCNRLGKTRKGLHKYGTEIREHANEQYSFIHRQLSNYPDNSPLKTRSEIREMRELIYKGKMNQLKNEILEQRKYLNSDIFDLEPDRMAIVYQELGILELMRRNFQQAEIDLEESLKLWNELPRDYPGALNEIVIVQRGLAELMLAKNDFYKARHILKDTLLLYIKEKYKFEENNLEYSKGLALTYLLYAILSSRQGKHFEVNWKLREVEQYLKEEGREDKETAAIYKLLKAYIHFFQDDTKSAVMELEEFKKEFKQLDKPALLATAEYYLLSILIRENKLNKAKSMLDELIGRFEQFDDKVNLANCLNTYGEYYYRAGEAFSDNKRNELNTQEEYFAKAEDYFLQARTLFLDIGALFGYSTCLADLFYLYVETQDEEKRFGIVKEIFSQKNRINNPYFKFHPLILEYDHGPLKVPNSLKLLFERYLKNKN